MLGQRTCAALSCYSASQQTWYKCIILPESPVPSAQWSVHLFNFIRMMYVLPSVTPWSQELKCCFILLYLLTSKSMSFDAERWEVKCYTVNFFLLINAQTLVDERCIIFVSETRTELRKPLRDDVKFKYFYHCNDICFNMTNAFKPLVYVYMCILSDGRYYMIIWLKKTCHTKLLRYYHVKNCLVTCLMSHLWTITNYSYQNFWLPLKISYNVLKCCLKGHITNCTMPSKTSN